MIKLEAPSCQQVLSKADEGKGSGGGDREVGQCFIPVLSPVPHVKAGTRCKAAVAGHSALPTSVPSWEPTTSFQSLFLLPPPGLLFLRAVGEQAAHSASSTQTWKQVCIKTVKLIKLIFWKC